MPCPLNLPADNSSTMLGMSLRNVNINHTNRKQKAPEGKKRKLKFKTESGHSDHSWPLINVIMFQCNCGGLYCRLHAFLLCTTLEVIHERQR